MTISTGFGRQLNTLNDVSCVFSHKIGLFANILTYFLHLMSNMGFADKA